MLEKLTAIEAKYSQIEARLSAPETYEDTALVARLNQEQAERPSAPFSGPRRRGSRPESSWPIRR